ncbi:MAG: hypothetical protein HC867_07875, partial [Bacteroidia bacterium]|nr:hypothetical protein [Bacteroidia bacterium]
MACFAESPFLCLFLSLLLLHEEDIFIGFCYPVFVQAFPPCPQNSSSVITSEGVITNNATHIARKTRD